MEELQLQESVTAVPGSTLPPGVYPKEQKEPEQFVGMPLTVTVVCAGLVQS